MGTFVAIQILTLYLLGLQFAANAIQNKQRFDISSYLDKYISGELDIVGNNSQIVSKFSAFRRYPLKGQRHLEKQIKFDNVDYNFGKDFTHRTGIYTAPVNGIYVFKYYPGKLPKKSECKLMKNQYEVTFLELDGGGGFNSRLDSFIRVVLELNQSDKVWLRLTHNENLKRRNALLNGTQFSGRLIVESTSRLFQDIRRSSSLLTNSRIKRDVSKSNKEAKLRRKRLVDVMANAPLITLVEPDMNGHQDAPNVIGSNTVSQPIAFSVSCTKSIVGGHVMETYGDPVATEDDESLESAEGRIKFDKIFVNLGNGFNLTTSEFKASVKGVYYFSFNVGKFPEKILSVIMMKNVNEVQVLIYNDSRTTSRGLQSQSLMLELNPGETIWLRAFEMENYGVFSNLGNYITFNGYLVYQL